MKNILITRDKNQGQEIASFLENKGFKAFVEPLFKVEKLAVKIPDFTEISAVIITSANACGNLINSDLPRDILVFVVGKKTAQILENVGFTNIKYPKENSALALKELILHSTIDKSKKIIYLHGPIISLDFTKELQPYDFTILKFLSYKIHEFESFSSELLEFVKNEKFEQVLLFSQNSAKIFFKLAAKHNLLEYFKDSSIVAINKKILLAAKNLGFKKLKTFSEIVVLEDFYE